MIPEIKALLTPRVDLEAKLLAVSLFLGRKVAELPQIVGPKGDKGDTGGIGPMGPRGRDGKQGAGGADGQSITGPVGPDGKPGRDGKNGVSVVNSEIAADDHLILNLSNGKIVDAGLLPSSSKSGYISTQLANFQIIVSDVAPANPSLNDLWLDTTP
jgi:hypothetical protein